MLLNMRKAIVHIFAKRSAVMLSLITCQQGDAYNSTGVTIAPTDMSHNEYMRH